MTNPGKNIKPSFSAIQSLTVQHRASVAVIKCSCLRLPARDSLLKHNQTTNSVVRSVTKIKPATTERAFFSRVRYSEVTRISLGANAFAIADFLPCYKV